MKTKQIVIVEVDRGHVSYDLYEVRDVDRRSHGEVIDDEAAESVIERLNAYFGARAIVARHVPPSSCRVAIPVGISARHVHLSRAHCDVLFGAGYELARRQAVTQPGQYVTQESVDVIGPRGELAKVAIINPLRAETQVELARTDAIHLGIDPPLRESGHLEATPGVRLRGPRGEVVLDHGAIIAQRHIHMNPTEALRLGVHDHDMIRVQAGGDREVVLGDVLVRVSPDYALDLHVDTDEANAAGLEPDATVTFAGIERRDS
ncbi:MAG: phosphate propanoyltransferase [Deltaproteobacteria bacterium]